MFVFFWGTGYLLVVQQVTPRLGLLHSETGRYSETSNSFAETVVSLTNFMGFRSSIT